MKKPKYVTIEEIDILGRPKLYVKKWLPWPFSAYSMFCSVETIERGKEIIKRLETEGEEKIVG